MPTEAPLSAEDTGAIVACAAVVDVPKAAEPDSFVLHAPLELLARALLLERVPPEARPGAHKRLQWLADRYIAAGPPADAPAPPSDLDVHDVVLSLAAAGHAPILASLRPRVPSVVETFGERLVAMELARNPDWRFEWPTTRPGTGESSHDLAERLAAPRSPGDPGTNFIYPTMHLTETSGLAAEVLEAPLRGLQVDEARRTLLRVAAHSMLQDDPDAAPYGWTHCLTLPQAVLVVADHGADPDVAVTVAATYVLGFRATLGQVRLDPAFTPARRTAAGRIWMAAEDERDGLVDEIVTFGALHPDAHVAKYTLACLDAAAADPEAERLFLAAAAHLQEWWQAQPAS
jgi:hypothetical protein